MQCAKQIYTAGIVEVFYKEEYKDLNGIEFLEKCNIKVTKV
jgi:deoxycytidylate deaminase